MREGEGMNATSSSAAATRQEPEEASCVRVDVSVAGGSNPEMGGEGRWEESSSSDDEEEEVEGQQLRTAQEEEDERAYEPEEKVRIEGFGEEELATWGDRVPPFSWRKLWAFTGPGFLMSIAYLDPGNIESDLQAGAQAGYSLLWVLFWATAMGLLLQLLAARLGVATGCHLAELCRMFYSKGVSLVLWVMAELAIVGSDIQEVIGTAIAVRIFSRNLIPLWAGVLITAVDSFAFLFLESFGIRKLEALFGGFIAIMAAAFARIFFATEPDVGAIARGLVIPSVPSGATSMAVSIIGAVIMPHNIFLHSALVQSRSIDRSSAPAVRDAMRYFTIESSLALLLSFFVNLFVVAVFAKLFFGHHAAYDIGLSNAGRFLQEAYGSSNFPIVEIWAIGLLAAGQSSTMTGTYAGQFVMSGFLDLHVTKWLRVLITRMVAIVPTMFVALLFRESSESNEMDVVSEWLNVLQSIQLPFAVIPLLVLGGSERVMGRFVVGGRTKIISWIVALIIIAVNIYLLIDFTDSALPHTPLVHSLLTLTSIGYCAFLFHLLSPAHLHSPNHHPHPHHRHHHHRGVEDEEQDGTPLSVSQVSKMDNLRDVDSLQTPLLQT